MSTTMDVILVESDDSENSIVEIEVPRKPTPPLIQIEDEEIILNVAEKNSETIMAKNFIAKDKVLVMAGATNSQAQDCPNHWTPDMVKFYNDDWGDEDQFIVEKIQEKMDKSPELWEVSRKDLFHSRSTIRRNVRCWNCQQHGHHFSLCPEPPYVLKCHMCGTEGHTESACPDSKCLNCGNYSDSYVYCCFKCKKEANQMCPRCRLVGHNLISCTDHWRLFHSTTGTTSVIEPKKQTYKLDKDTWCCNCGKQGHHQFYCRQRKDSIAFKDTLPYVVSYKKAFNYKDFNNKPVDSYRKKTKNKKKEKHKSDKLLRLNPMNKAICKDKAQLKVRLKMFKKKRRKKERRRIENF